jgi:cellulose synthase/poly-beta-1,6-N-acetylglucosamine synthase-like glycosyltransferase
VKLSVVIPALDEAERIETAIRGAFDAPPEPSPESLEVIVVDGGSSDATAQLAAAAGARVLRGERGRARQLAAGVRASDGDVVLLLHADTRLPRGWRTVVCDALRDERVVGGAFRLCFDEQVAGVPLHRLGGALAGAPVAVPVRRSGGVRAAAVRSRRSAGSPRCR